MWWLLERSIADDLAAMRQAGVTFTDEQRAEFQARVDAEALALGGTPRNLKVLDDTAQITVEGVLTEKPDIFMMLFGGGNTTYESIRASLALVESDASIKRVVLNISSPGGTVHGLFDTLGAIESFKKPISVRTSYAASAAYAIAAAAGKIEATNAAVQVGSIGVAAQYLKLDSVIDITSTEAPDKRPDPSTPEGQAVIRAQLDALHDVFVDAIARGRGTTVRDVNANFGRGAVLLAGEAKRRGMIDRVAKPSLRAISASDNGDTSAADTAPAVATHDDDAPAPVSTPHPTAAGAALPSGEVTMNEQELLEKYPSLHAAVFGKGKAEGEAGKQAAVDAALEEERDRVDAHLTAGEHSGDMATAVEAVRKGTKMTQTLMVKYTMSATNRADSSARQSESDAAATAVDGATTTEEQPTEDFGDKVVALLEARRGKKKEAANG